MPASGDSKFLSGKGQKARAAEAIQQISANIQAYTFRFQLV